MQVKMVDKKSDELEELRQKVETNKEFINVAAHQLQEPLAATKWQLENLLAERSGPLKVKQRSVIDEVYSINQDAIRLVKDLLFVARLEGGRLKIDKKPTDLVALFDRIKQRYEPTIKEYRGVMHYDTPREPLPKVPVDVRLLNQAIDNLVSNALKYSAANTHIDLAIKRDGEKVVLSIFNKGPAIPKDKQAQLFEKFSRAESKGTEKTGGTGLGLYITKQIIELHGGEITFESAEGKGTTFFINLPLI